MQEELQLWPEISNLQEELEEKDSDLEFLVYIIIHF